jgi:hypothetical protein
MIRILLISAIPFAWLFILAGIFTFFNYLIGVYENERAKHD